MTRDRDDIGFEYEYVKGVYAEAQAIHAATGTIAAALGDAWTQLAALIPAAVVSGEGDHVMAVNAALTAIGAGTIDAADAIGRTIELLTGRLRVLLAELDGET